MPAPTFFGQGTLNGENSGSSITPIGFPASIANKDVAVLGVACNGSSTFTTPSGQGAWQVLGTSLESDAGQSTEWYWLRLNGTETAETVAASASFSNSIGGFGQIWVFRGCVETGNPFEGVGNDGTVAQTTPDTTACTTTGTDRLVVSLVFGDLDTAWSVAPPPAGWSAMGTRQTTTVGGNAQTDAIQRTVATAQTIPAAQIGTWGASIRYRTITFALIPAAGPTATPGTFTLTPVAATPVPGPVSVAADVGSLTLSPVAGTPAPGPVSVAASPGEFTLSPVTATPVPGSAIAATVGEFTLSPVAGTPVPGAVAVAATPGEFTLSPVPGIATPGGVTVAATPGTLTFDPIPGTPVPGPSIVAAEVGTFTLAPVPGTLAGALVAEIGTFTLTPVPATPVPGPVSIAAEIGTLTLAPVPATPHSPVIAAVGTLTLTPVPATPVPGSVTVAAAVGTLTLVPVAVGVQAGPEVGFAGWYLGQTSDDLPLMVPEFDEHLGYVVGVAHLGTVRET